MKIVALNVDLPSTVRDQIAKAARARGMTQPTYVRWACEQAELAVPRGGAPTCDPMPAAIEQQFTEAFRQIQAGTKSEEHLTVETRLAALRESVLALVSWARQAHGTLRERGKAS